MTSLSQEAFAAETFSTPTGSDLVRECIPLVHHHVRAVLARVPAHVDRDELVSAGMYALVTCAAKYDPAVGTSFAQFASTRVRGALVDELRSMDWASRSVRKKARDVATKTEELGQTLGRSATDVEIAAALEISSQALGEIRSDARRGEVVSLQAMSTDDSESLPSSIDGPDTVLLQHEQLTTLRTALGDLPDRLRRIVEESFFGQRKMSEIAADLGVTESRVSQLHSQALAVLRESMREPSDQTPAPAPAARPVRRHKPARTLAAVG